MTHGIWTKNVNGKDVVRTAYSPSDAVRFQNDGYRQAQQQVETAVHDAAGAGAAEQPAGQITVVQTASTDDGTAETAKSKQAPAKAAPTK